MRTPVVFALVCCSVAAQTTSPVGFATTEGNATFAHWGGSRRFQQIDADQVGAPFPITSISWRRNGGYTSATSLRTFDLQLDLGACNFTSVSEELDLNHLPGSRTTVFNGQISFPDWSQPQATPAPFDLTATFASPYVYLAQDALVIDFAYINNTSSGSLTTDRQFNGPTTPTTGALLGVGCIATGQTAAFTHTSGSSNFDAVPTPAYGLRLRLGGANAPTTGGVLCLIDVADQNIGGILCSTLHAGPVITLPMGSLATGLVPNISIGFPHNATLVGQTLVSQLAAPDAGQPIPVVLSNARQTTITSTVFSGGSRCCYGWYGTPSTTGTATTFFGGGMVMQLQ